MVMLGTLFAGKKLPMWEQSTKPGGLYVIPLIYIYEGDDKSACICTQAAITDISRAMCNGTLASASKWARWARYIEASPSRKILHWCSRASSCLARFESSSIEPRRAGSSIEFWKIGESDWTFEPGYPLLDRITFYEQQMEIVTGKHSEGLHH